VPEQVIHVEISKDEKITLKSTGTTVATRSTSLDMLARDVRQLQGEVSQGPVVITAERSIKYETVVKAMDILQRAGVQRVGLAVQLVD
jgi:biopolymer transport protein TolR